MSKLFFFILLLLSLQAEASSFVMKTIDSIPPLSREDYQRLSKRQSTKAIVLVSVGGAAFIYGAGYIAAELAAEQFVAMFGIKESNAIPAGYFVAMFGGAILALCSIPAFKSARQNRRLAKRATVGLNMEKLSNVPTATLTKSYFPALRITFRF